MKKPLYVIKPGYVYSRNDGDRHYISYSQLVQLYGVPLKYCIQYGSGRYFMSMEGYSEDDTDVITLAPRYDGDYEQMKYILADERREYEEIKG
jgi:hypothetical protein